jgi:hypothetical protein
MAKFIRYALASVCFTASVACLALWWRSMKVSDRYVGPDYFSSTGHLSIQSYGGRVIVYDSTGPRPYPRWHRLPQTDEMLKSHSNYLAKRGQFGLYGPSGIHFPLWYPALIFVIAGVAALRFRRQFSIRSALIAVSVVALLLGMVVIL